MLLNKTGRSFEDAWLRLFCRLFVLEPQTMLLASFTGNSPPSKHLKIQTHLSDSFQQLFSTVRNYGSESMCTKTDLRKRLEYLRYHLKL